MSGISDTCRLIRDDIAIDVPSLDTVPFTGAGLGPHLGNLYGMVDALAVICAEQQATIDRLLTEVALNIIERVTK